MRKSKLRIAIPAVVLGGLAVAYGSHLPIGSLSSFGWTWISALCPLGALSALIAEKTFIPQAVASVVLFVAAAVVLGRAFCGWICPVPLVQKLRPSMAQSAKDTMRTKGASRTGGAWGRWLAKAKASSSSSCSACKATRRHALDSRHVIAGGSLLTAALFGFPVFCLVCPIGLSFAFVVLVMNLFAEGDLTWGLVMVPLILLLEVAFFRKWCSNICPLSAAMSLASRAATFLRPQIDESRCIEASTGKACGRCASACPQGINPRHPSLGRDACECTKCFACVEECPAQAIALPLLNRSGSVSPEGAGAEEVRVG